MKNEDFKLDDFKHGFKQENSILSINIMENYIE